MKKRIYLFILSFVLLISLAATFEVDNTFPLFGKLIILDPGHGSKDPGSISGTDYEKDYNLDFAMVLKNKLETLGATVMMTRTGDYDLSIPDSPSRKRSDFNNRIKLINESSPDLYLSLHMNSIASSNYFGAQAFYSDVNAQNEVIAANLQDKLNRFLNLDKEYKKIGEDKYMFPRLTPPGVLIEYGFLSSSKDKENLKNETYKSDLAAVIADSIIDYFT